MRCVPVAIARRRNPARLVADSAVIGAVTHYAPAGLWAAVTPINLNGSLIALVSAGGDTDTSAAHGGGVLGARYGASAIPQIWLDCIPQRGRIEGLTDDLPELSGG